jgi:aromatic ring hydroxylase
VTYAIVPPQIDRSKPAHQQKDPALYAGAVNHGAETWAEATFGLMGRTPDHVAGFIAGYAAKLLWAKSRLSRCEIGR